MTVSQPSSFYFSYPTLSVHLLLFYFVFLHSFLFFVLCSRAVTSVGWCGSQVVSTAMDGKVIIWEDED
eukprot:m.85861 g.85861  ORF g.85861 m.85861 type:complete len:68 (+) comp12200_c0_seq5:1646-1849(+)